ncbi:MAG: CPBP family intramembrane metalloprotease [Opitutaceae bacterium]|nr:CPBP family intramembrane metalloprotease [Opitutaceae bacterium]
MSPKIRLGLVLWIAGFTGIASVLLLDFEALLALLPESAREGNPRITPAIKLLGLVQPAAILTLAVFGGVTLTPKVGLSAPAVEAWAAGRPVLPALRPQWLPGVLGGLGGGLAILLIAALTHPWLPPGAAASISTFSRLMPFVTRLLYGGITEELLLRWGLMTLLAWGCWRMFQKHRARPPGLCFHGAILLSAAVFGAGHLPVAFLVVPEPNFALVAFVLLANAAFGVIAGYLFWKRGLESAIAAHMVTHVVLLAASRLGVYF